MWVLIGWAALIAGSFVVGAILRRLDMLPIDRLPPLHARPRLLTVTLLPAAAFAAVAVIALPYIARRWSFRAAVTVAFGCTLAWTVLLAISADGPAQPFTHKEEYLAVLPEVGDDPLGWLATFTERLPGYPTHVRGHPPLPVLVLWALAEAGLPGPFWASLLVIAVGCAAMVAITVTVCRLAGEDAARRALPYLVLAPSAVWIATTMDAFFAGVGAWGVALLVLGRRTFTRIACGIGAGVLLGALPYLSYGLVPYLLIPVAVIIVARVPQATVRAAVAGAAAVTAAFATAGFFWPSGVLATHAEWSTDAGAARPYLYFLIANLAVLALLTGPAVAAGLARTPPGRIRTLVLAALIAVLVLDVSGVTRGEVERIWVPYAVWIGVAAGHAARSAKGIPGGLAGGLAAGPPGGRGWLTAQAVTGLLLQALVMSPW